MNEFKDALKATNVHPTVLTIRLEKAPLSLHRELLKVSANVVPATSGRQREIEPYLLQLIDFPLSIRLVVIRDIIDPTTSQRHIQSIENERIDILVLAARICPEVFIMKRLSEKSPKCLPIHGRSRHDLDEEDELDDDKDDQENDVEKKAATVAATSGEASEESDCKEARSKSGAISYQVFYL